jgi:ABC-type transport system involved in multi-copper enzyme maturation permease subunit
MATTSTQLPAVTTGHTLPATAGQATFMGAVRSEITKIRSVRSTYWTLLALIVVTVGFGALASWGAASHGDHGPGFDPTMRSLGGLYISQLVIAVLGVLVVTSEYSTGMIRTTLMTMPRRGTMIAAKAAVFTAVALITGLITCFASFFLGQALMSSHHINATLGQPNVLRAIIGGALFLTVCGLLAFGIGLLLRHSAGAITTVVGLLFVISILVNFLPQSWQIHVDKWIPALAGTQIWSTVSTAGQSPPMFSPWVGFAVLCGYAAIALIAGVLLFRRRDA